MHSWGLLGSQPSLMDEIQANERLSQKPRRGCPMEQHFLGPPHAHVCVRTHIHTPYFPELLSLLAMIEDGTMAGCGGLWGIMT